MSEKDTPTSRRQFLKGAGVIGAAGALLPIKSAAAGASKPRKAKNLIFLMVDGMCNGTLGLAHHWHLRNRGEPLNWMQLYDRPDLRTSFQDTASASSPVTDSAAAASSWGCGQRVMNRAINTAADGTALEPLYTRAKRVGKRTGLVSTCTISHATPAGFAANVPHRGDENTIVRQYLERGVDVLLGGGSKFFVQQQKDGTKIDYFRKFEESGYRLARNKAELGLFGKKQQQVLGVFSDGHIPFAIDRKNDVSLSEVPGLADMFTAALAQLENSPEGFILQVEAGRVDHAGHANDPASILHELLEYDACIPIALDYIEKHPDTMLIVTTDHGTGGCQLDGHGDSYNDSGPALDRINQFKYSFEWLQDRYRATGRFEALPFTLATGITPTEEQAAKIQAIIENPEIKYLSSAMTRVFSKELTEVTATGWSSNNHTSENVELLAFGPGSQQIPAFIRNYELHGIMTEALGI